MSSSAFDFNPFSVSSNGPGGDLKPKLWVKKLYDDGTPMSPIISPNDVAAAIATRLIQVKKRQLPGIDIRETEQLELLRILSDKWLSAKQNWTAEKQDKLFYHYDNNSYSYFDAVTLFSMVSFYKPKRVLAFVDEYQFSCFLDIIDALELTNTTEFIFIEPDPDRLRGYTKLPSNSRHRILCNNLQSLKLTYFTALQENDMLFVDTTHVAKAASDVTRLFSEILPSLAPGVLVHIHDVFWPFEYPDGWLTEGRSWNECYLLRSFLQFNSAFEVGLFLNYLWTFHETECVKLFPESKLNPGGAIWLRRKN